MKVIMILLFILIILFYCISENFVNFDTPHIFIDNNFYQPWWNSTRNTRNNNYDIRG